MPRAEQPHTHTTHYPLPLDRHIHICAHLSAQHIEHMQSPPSLRPKMSKFSLRGAAPHPAGALPQTPSGLCPEPRLGLCPRPQTPIPSLSCMQGGSPPSSPRGRAAILSPLSHTHRRLPQALAA